MFLALDLDYDSGSCDGDGGEDVCDGVGDGNGGDGYGDGEWGPQTFFVLMSSLLAPTGFLIYIHRLGFYLVLHLCTFV